MHERPADILVAGAGPAGATIARLLACKGRRVTLVDPGARRVDRLEVIAPAACRVVQAVGIAHFLHDASLAHPCPGIRRRWGRDEIEIDDFLRRPGGRGYVIDRVPFDDALRAMAMDAGVVCVSGRVVAVRCGSDGMTVELQSGTQRVPVAAGLVIDATGRPSAVARRMGARRLVGERLVAERQPTDDARISTPNACWLEVEGGQGDGQGGDQDHGWSYEVSGPGQRRDRWAIRRPAQRRRSHACADASSALLSRAAGEGWIAVGDAAASFDPVTSQGLANALSTALVAAGAILSPGGLDEGACGVYSDAVAATFRYSEAGRARVYDALTPTR
jgi:flavin-dependent dehydrogenase